MRQRQASKVLYLVLQNLTADPFLRMSFSSESRCLAACEFIFSFVLLPTQAGHTALTFIVSNVGNKTNFFLPAFTRTLHTRGIQSNVRTQLATAAFAAL